MYSKIIILIAMCVSVMIGIFIGGRLFSEETPAAAPEQTNQSITNNQTKPPVNQPTDDTTIPANSTEFSWQFNTVVLGGSAGNETDSNILMADVITLPDGSYRMFYNAGGKGNGLIKYADSSDGRTGWVVGGTAIQGGQNSEDDDYIIGGSRVLQLQDGTYRMYYRATPDHAESLPPSYSIYMATSVDGKIFTKQGVVIANTRENANSAFSLVGHGAFYQLDDGTFAGFFSGNLVNQAGPSDLFFTTSSDGLVWTEPTMLYKGVHDPTVVKTEQGFIVMAMYLKDWVGVAVSTDGTTWPTAMESAPIKDASGKTIDLSMIGDLCLAIMADGALALYSNYTSASERGIATYYQTIN